MMDPVLYLIVLDLGQYNMDINLFYTTRCEEIYKIEHGEVW